MKYSIALILCFSSITAVATIANTEVVQQAPISCAKELQSLFSRARQLPEVEDLLENILADGPIQVRVNDRYSSEFDGYWENYSRTIFITKKRHSTEESMLTTLMHELHNAYRNKDLCYYDLQARKGQISKKDYIRAIEYVEYLNARDASTILAKGIDAGLYPKGTAWHIPNDFETHLRLQQSSGHSAWIGKTYSYLRSS